MESRMKDLEVKVDGIEHEVTTLTERVGGHIAQSAADKSEAKEENEKRHAAQMLLAEETLSTVRDNATRFAVMDGVEEALNKLNGHQRRAPLLTGHARTAAMAGGGLTGVGGALWIAIEIWRDLIVPMFSGGAGP